MEDRNDQVQKLNPEQLEEISGSKKMESDTDPEPASPYQPFDPTPGTFTPPDPYNPFTSR